MYYQKTIMNAFKHILVVIKSNCSMANVCTLTLKKNKCIAFSPQIKEIKRSCNTYREWKDTNRNKVFIVSASFLLNLFKPKEEKDDTEELIMTIKRSILLIQKEEFSKAEQMLHIALRQAQILQHYDGITYVYDVMANLAYDINDFKKAEQLFKSVLQRLMAKGVPEDDLTIIHISLKVADIYNKRGDIEKADNGYNFCLQHLQNHLAKDNENENVLKLLGLTLEKYAAMCFSQSQYSNALKYLLEAYEISVKINGQEDEQTVVLLNDLGSVNYMLEKHDEAIKYLSKAAELGKKLPDMVDLSSIYVNLGNILISKGLYEEARQNCIEGGRLAKTKDDNDSIEEANKCLEMIRGFTR